MGVCGALMPSLPDGILRGSLTGILVVLGDYKEFWSIQLCPKCGIHEVYAIEVEIFFSYLPAIRNLYVFCCSSCSSLCVLLALPNIQY